MIVPTTTAMSIAAVLVAYVVILGQPERINEIVRIPLLQYGVIGLCYLLFLGAIGVARLAGGEREREGERERGRGGESEDRG